MISECTFDLSLQKVHYYLLFINYRVERSFADTPIFSFISFLASPRILLPKQGVLGPPQGQHHQQVQVDPGLRIAAGPPPG